MRGKVCTEINTDRHRHTDTDTQTQTQTQALKTDKLTIYRVRGRKTHSPLTYSRHSCNNVLPLTNTPNTSDGFTHVLLLCECGGGGAGCGEGVVVRGRVVMRDEEVVRGRKG